MLSARLRHSAPPSVNFGPRPGQPQGLPNPRPEPEQADWSSPLGWFSVALGVAGTACALASSLPGAPPPSATHELVIMDDFRGELSHGALVEQVLRGTEQCGPGSGREVHRVSVNLDAHLDRDDSLEEYVTRRFRTPLEETARGLNELRGPAIVHQSQGASESRVVESLWGRSQADAEFRAHLAGEVGVPPQASDSELLQAVVDRVHAIHGSAELQQARSRLLAAADQAAEQGAIRVLSAGNQGELQRTFDRLGVSVPDGFYRSDLADPLALVVGAADDRGTLDPRDDRAAALASPGAGAVVGADGVDRPYCRNGEIHHHSGSSYAAPQVSRRLDEAWLLAPGASRSDLLEGLLDSAEPVPGAESFLGQGILR